MPFDSMTGWRREFWKWFILATMVMQLFSLYFHWQAGNLIQAGTDQRQEIQRQQAVFQSAQEQNRSMLDARARIQISIINAIKNGRTFTAGELLEIQELWSKAEYNTIQERFLE